MYYIIVLLMFVVTSCINFYIDRFLNEEKKKREKAKKEITPILKRVEKKYNVKKSPLFNLRMLSVFSYIEDEKEKEDIRNEIEDKLNKKQFKYTKNLLFILAKVFIYAICIYTIFFFLYQKPIVWLSVVTAVLIVFNLIKSKKIVLAIIISIMCLIFYVRISSTLMLYILLGTMLRIAKNYTLSKRKKKNKDKGNVLNEDKQR